MVVVVILQAAMPQGDDYSMQADSKNKSIVPAGTRKNSVEDKNLQTGVPETASRHWGHVATPVKCSMNSKKTGKLYT